MKYKLLYIHGITVDKDSNKLLEEVCNEKGIEFVALDLPGHGKEPFNKIELTLEAYGDFVKQWVIQNEHNKNLIVYGHSMGGGIAAYITSQYQKELKIKKLILEDPLNGMVFKHVNDFKSHPIKTLKKVNQLKSDESSKENHYVIDWLKRIHRTIPITSWDEFIKLTDEIVSKESCLRLDEYYKNIKVDIDLIFGTNDCIIPFEESVKHIKGLNKGVKLHKVKNAGHGPHDEQPKEYRKIISKILEGK